MAAFKSWGYMGFFLLISSQLLQIFSANAQIQNQPSKKPVAEVSKTWGAWTFPTPKPEERKPHREGGRHGGECTCNCNCDCEKTQCKDEGRSKGGGPVVCMPMECDHLGCKFEGGGGGISEASTNFHLPYFTVAGAGPQGTKSSGDINTTEAGHR